MAKLPDDRARVYCETQHIRDMLERHHWTQSRLAKEMAKQRREIGNADSERRTVARILKGEAVTVETADRVAAALDISLADIIAVDPLGDVAHTSTLLQQIALCDTAGKHERAIQLGVDLLTGLERSWKKKKQADPRYGDAHIQVAMVYDHHGQPDEGIKLLDRFLNSKLAKQAAFHEQRLWAVYQRAVLMRNLLTDMLERSAWRIDRETIDRHIKQCSEDLSFVRNLADESMRIAVDHQRGVLAQLQGDYQHALDLFQDSLRRRIALEQAAPAKAARHRLAYEHRRIAQCLAHLGQDPRPAFERAIKVARKEKHQRLLRELVADKRAFTAVYTALHKG